MPLIPVSERSHNNGTMVAVVHKQETDGVIHGYSYFLVYAGMGPQVALVSATRAAAEQKADGQLQAHGHNCDENCLAWFDVQERNNPA